MEFILEIDPNLVRFAHSRIRPLFSGCGRRVEDTLNDIVLGRLAIDDLLGCIPSIDIIKMNSYIRSISSKLTVYEKLKDIATLLELALWKSNSQNLKTKGNLRAKKLQRIMCGADVIIPNVLSFLMVDRWT